MNILCESRRPKYGTHITHVLMDRCAQPISAEMKQDKIGAKLQCCGGKEHGRLAKGSVASPPIAQLDLRLNGRQRFLKADCEIVLQHVFLQPFTW